jgi:replicative DNA helicase
MNEKNFGYLGTTFQQGLLKTIIEDKKFAVVIIDVIKSSYFDGPYFKYLMENIKELYELYNVIPSYDTLQQKILAENVNTSGKVHIDTLADIKNLIIEDNKYIKKTSLNFCRQQVVRKALKESDEIIQNGAFEEYNRIETLITDALQVGATTDDITEISTNVRESLQKDARVPFPTGIDGIDALLKGGLARGELGIILAPTGIGKTTILTKFANAGYIYDASVLQIIFEDNPNEIRKKHYTIWTGIAPDDQQKSEDEVVRRVTELTESHKNRLYLLKLSPFGISVADIRNKIRKLESEGKKIDLLILDYLDCISLEKSIENGEEWKGEGTITRTLEAMASEFNIAIWTATQGNRESIAAEVVTTDQMGGSIKKAQIGHVVISIAKTLPQKEHNLANITLLKSRIGKDGIIFQNCKFDNEYLQFDTDAQNTLLGHEEERAEAKKQHAADIYKESLERKSKVRKEVEESRLKLESAVSKTLDEKEQVNENLNQLQNFEESKEIEIELPPIEDITIDNGPFEILNPPDKSQLTLDELNRKHVAEVYKMSKLKNQQKVDKIGINSG